jgi:type VI secretion system secreted protein VgrG
MRFIQSNRAIRVSTPLGEDKLIFHRMTAREQLGRLFEFTLDLLSDDEAISLSDALGQQMTVTAELPDGSERYFNGYVSRFTHVGRHGQLARYQATLVPWFWFLTRTSDCKIFQEKKVPDIIKEVFRDNGFTDFEDLLTGVYREWEYCVQYRETDFNFVSRLMEQEGICYYFKHVDGKHTLCLADDYGSHETVPNYDEIPYFPPDNPQRRERDHIFDWSVSQEVKTGAYVIDDFDFERPKADLLAKSVISRQHSQSDHEFYDYPGEYVQTADGDGYVKKRIEEQQAEHERAHGTANACGLMAGALFSLSGYPRDDQNREYLIVATTNELQDNAYETGGDGVGTSWQCSFEAMDSRQPFRSPRRTPKPIVQGPQTAIVVGKKGEEIWTDKYGRVKVQFHWDRYGKSDENSSCWVRVAQLWAGKTWGAIHIPRIGQEVIVEFLEGDPDRPIITGRVYNADEMPPYDLPANQTQSGIKSRSTKDATNQNFNELRFEDKKDSEQIYFHAEKDFERIVENNDTLKVGFEKKDAGDQVIDIHNNQKVTIGNSKSKNGSQTITIWKDLTETIKTGNETIKIEKGKRTTTIQGDDALTIKTGNQKIKISAGKNTTEAAQSILLKVGASSIKIEPACITLKSVQIKIEGSATLDMKAAMTTCKGSAMLTLKGGMTMIN